MKKLLFLLPLLLIFSCTKQNNSITAGTPVKFTCFADEISEGESVIVDVIYQLQGESPVSHSLEMYVQQGIVHNQVGLGQLVDLESLSLDYQTPDQVKIWHTVTNMDESETYEEISPTDLHNTSMQFDYNF